METLMQDLRFALRSLRRTPGFTAVVVGVIALGIGVNAMIFGMVYGLLLRPWPLPQPERIVTLTGTIPSRNIDDLSLSWLHFHDLRDRSRSYESIGGFWDHQGVVTLDKDPVRLFAASITSGVLPTLGIKPVIGRNFRPEEEVWGRNWNQVIISHRIWQKHYGGSSAALGRALRLNGRVREIVGVMPEGILFPEVADFWIPAGFDAKESTRDAEELQVIARLKPGVTAAQAAAEARTIFAGILAQNPAIKDRGIALNPMREMRDRGVRPLMIVMLVAVVFVLLIACANVANLMLARAAMRQREIALRLAMGATRGRIVRQLLTESVLCSGFGGLLGIALANWGNTLWAGGIPVEKPWYMRFDLDGPVLVYTALITVLAGIVFGLAPALHASDQKLSETLRDGSAQAGSSPASRRMRSGLVVAEIAFSLVLLIGAGLMVRTFVGLDQRGQTLRSEGVVHGRVLLPIASYGDEPARRVFFREAMRRLAALPGVSEVSGANNLVLGRNSWGRNLLTPDMATPSDGKLVDFATVFPGYFRLLGMRLARGREFGPEDDERGQRVAVVSENLAKALWGKGDPLGRRIKIEGDADSLGWRTVVGVVEDIQNNVEGNPNRVGLVYAPQYQDTQQLVSILIRSGAGVGPVAAGFRDVIRSLDADIAVQDLRTLNEEFRAALWVRRLFASLIAVFGVIALLIAGVGLYGVMAYSVAQRTQEIGIRMALGAEVSSVMRLVVGQALRLTGIGIVIGLAGAFALTRFMGQVIYGVSPTDPPTFTIVSVLLALSGLIAAWVPAIRATRVDPMVALRSE